MLARRHLGGSGDPLKAGPIDERPPSGLDRQPLRPELLSAAESYPADGLRRDLLAGLTVAIVALPLSMAIAIASGLPPERGLFAAVVGGFLISLLGGSRHQIGGPAGAFIVLVAAVLERHGYDGLLLAVALSGLIMIALGVLRLGGLIRLVPAPVIVGFTSGIGVIILVSQMKDLLGLTIEREPAAFWPKLNALWSALPSLSPAAVALAVLTIASIIAVRRWRPLWPALLIAIVAAALVGSLLGLNVATIGSRFGGIPSSLPAPVLPPISWDKIMRVLPDAVALALLGSIESLLSAVVADKMSGLRHRSDMELVAQGVANIGAAVFASMPVTGTIARTATNVRAGAVSPLAGLAHALFLLIVIAVASDLASYIPLAALAGLLAVTSWSMIEWHALAHLVRTIPADAVVAVVTTLITVIVDLLTGIAVGTLMFVCIHTLRRRL